MAIVDQKWSALRVPHAMEGSDRIPGERSFDPDVGLPSEKLLPTLRSINLDPLERPVVDLGF